MRVLLRLLSILIIGASLQTASIAGEPKVTDIDWENACGGSNIRITRVDGQIVAIDASVEHYSEGRQWQCHYTNGKIVSALYRHSKVKRKMVGDAGEFTTELIDDDVRTFHFPEHKLKGIPSPLLKDLQEVITKAKG